MFCDKHIKQENILVGCVPIAAVASTPGGYTLPPAIPHSPPWVYPNPPMVIPYPPDIPTPSPRYTLPLERTWYQGYPPPPRKKLVPGIPYLQRGPGTIDTYPQTGPGTRDTLPPERTWYQGYPTPPSNRQTPVKTLPSCDFVGGR